MSTGTTSDGRPTGSNHDPIWTAYQDGTPELQDTMRAFLTSDLYSVPELSAALTYLTGTNIGTRDVDSFKRKLATGRVTL